MSQPHAQTSASKTYGLREKLESLLLLIFRNTHAAYK